MKNKLFFTGIIILLFIGCKTLGKIYPVQMSSKLGYYGFSIERPIYNNWYLRPEQQGMSKAILYREHENKTHSVYFLVFMDSVKQNSFEEYANFYYKKYVCINDSVRFILKKSTIEKVGIYATETYKFYSKTIDKGSYNAPDKNLILENYGFIKKHPFLPNKAVVIAFSERGTEDDFNETFAKESEFFFSSVEFRNK